METNRVIRSIVYFLLGVLEVLLAFRLIFKLLGANSGGSFVTFIYNFTGVFLAPFSGIFRIAVNNGIETKSVLEPATIIAMVVYALIGYGIVVLIKIFKTPKGSTQLQDERDTGSKTVVTNVETTDGTQLQGERDTDSRNNQNLRNP
jgi:glucan phosphoethanolaminetransferase (alkaline phosphatase superfamily)